MAWWLPAVEQDFDLSEHLPKGHGLGFFSQANEALDGFKRIQCDHPRGSAAASAPVREFLGAERLRQDLLPRAGAA